MELADVPRPLREAVEKYINKNPTAKVLHVEVYENTPFKDKSRVTHWYKVFIDEHGGLLLVFRLWDLYPDATVSCDSMIAGEINVFLKHSSWFKLGGVVPLAAGPSGQGRGEA